MSAADVNDYSFFANLQPIKPKGLSISKRDAKNTQETADQYDILVKKRAKAQGIEITRFSGRLYPPPARKALDPEKVVKVIQDASNIGRQATQLLIDGGMKDYVGKYNNLWVLGSTSAKTGKPTILSKKSIGTKLASHPLFKALIAQNKVSRATAQLEKFRKDPKNYVGNQKYRAALAFAKRPYTIYKRLVDAGAQPNSTPQQIAALIDDRAQKAGAKVAAAITKRIMKGKEAFQ